MSIPGSGGLPARRPDQVYNPPAGATQPGSASGIFRGRLVIVSGTSSNGSNGIFVYSGTPGLGNLIVSIAASAGTDQYGNPYPEGLNVTAGVISGGTFEGTDFIINSAGAFFYTGTPAAGNLFLSIAAVAGTDGFGNAYKAPGMTVYGASGQAVFVGLIGGTTSTFIFYSGASIEQSPAQINAAVLGSGATEFINWNIFGPQLNVAGFNDRVIMELNSSTQGGPASANGSLVYVTPGNVDDLVASWGPNGFTIGTLTSPFFLANGVSGGAFSGGAEVFATSSHLKYEAQDGTSYSTGRKSIVSATTQTFSTNAFVTINGMTVPLAVGTYEFDCYMNAKQGTVAAAQALEFVASGGLVASSFFADIEMVQVTSAVGTNQAVSTALTTSIPVPAFGITVNFFIRIHGFIIVSTAGTFAVAGAAPVAADTWSVSATRLDVKPVI
jgi:hypothetical protein